MKELPERHLEMGIVNAESIAYAKQKIKEMYERTISVYEKWMDMPKNQIKLHALYDIGTYFHDLFNTFPFLFVNAMRESGKTRLLNIHSHLACGSGNVVHSGLTESTCFRWGAHKTLVIDECEQIKSKNKGELREYLNASYKRGGVVFRNEKVKVKEGETYAMIPFKPFKPIIMANIYGFEEVLSTRAIITILDRSSDPSKIKKQENFDDDEEIIEINRTLREISVVLKSDKTNFKSEILPLQTVITPSVVSVCILPKNNILSAWNSYIDAKYGAVNGIHTHTTLTTLNYTKLHYKELKEEEIIKERRKLEEKLILEDFFDKIDNTGIDGRNLELFFPLFVIAREIGEEVFLDFLEIAKQMVLVKKEDEFTESRDIGLLDFLSTHQDYVSSYIPVKKITMDFRTYLGDQQGEEQWINEYWVGNALKRLNILLAKKRVASGKLVLLNFPKILEKLKVFKEKET